MDDFRFSVEELALVMSLAGSPEMAHSFMFAQLGDMSKEEARARLLAAAHSLLARRWITPGPQGENVLAAPIVPVAEALTQASFSLRYQRVNPELELLMTFHFVDTRIYAHIIEQSVVHHIIQLDDREAVVQQGVVFFGLDKAEEVSLGPVDLPLGFLDDLRQNAYAKALDRLESQAAPRHLVQLLREDFNNTQYRGSALRVEYGPDGTPKSEKGLLVLGGLSRLWFFQLTEGDGEPHTTLYPGSREVFQQQVMSLMSS
jgi:hypothetical protein